MARRLKTRNINGLKVFFRQAEEFERIYQGIFINQEYTFQTSSKTPFIIDGGSHIGLSVLYFKTVYPQVSILAFEPDPDNFSILNQNVEANHLSDITLVNAALSDRNTITTLYGPGGENPWTWANTIIDNTYGEYSDPAKAKTKTVRLSPYITKNVDMLKLDIEGAEQNVLQEIEPKLKFVRNIAMEYHVTKTTRNINSLAVIKSILQRQNFKVRVVYENLRNNLQSDIEQDPFLNNTQLEVALVYASR